MLTSIGAAAAPAARIPSLSTWAIAAAVALFAQVAYGVDFPRLNRRFSRLV